MISFEQKGDFKNLTSFLERVKGAVHVSNLDEFGKRGVAALSAATPVDTGATASMWSYKIERQGDTVSINFCNDNINNNVPIAIILQYGHGTKGGGYVQGRDYINPAVQPIFDEIANKAWREVSK